MHWNISLEPLYRGYKIKSFIYLYYFFMIFLKFSDIYIGFFFMLRKAIF